MVAGDIIDSGKKTRIIYIPPKHWLLPGVAPFTLFRASANPVGGVADGSSQVL